MPLATAADLRRARRVLLHGVSGSGKSTAALALGRTLGLPVHLADEEFGWLPNWTQRPAEEMRHLAEAVAAEPEWIFDTAYSAFRDLVEPRADIIVGLDYPRWLSLSRLIRRTVHRAVTRQEICNGNVETWRQLLSRDSIVLWHFKSFRRKRDAMRAWASRTDGTPVMLLKHPRELKQVLSEIQQPA